MSFYLKLLLIFSFVGQSIAVACVDTIVGRYDAPRKLFNTSSYEGKLKQDAPEINDHSQKIEGILVDEKRVDVNRSATINEKEKIVKAVIAERFIAKKVQMTLSGQRTSDINPYKKICTDLALAGHFKVLELTWDFADEARNYFSDDVIKIDFSKFSANKYEDLYSLLGIDESLCKEWFAEMFYEHFAGLQNPETCEEIRDSYSRGLEISCGDSERNKEVRLSYLFKSFAEVSSHPFAFYAASELLNKRKYIPIEIAMNAFRVIAENDEHTCQYHAAVWLFESGNPDDTRIAMNAFRRTARNNGHENQYFAAEQLFESGNPDDTRIAIDTFVHIATDTMDTNQCNAAERLIQLEADEYGDEYVIAMDALRLAARNNGHENQYFAAKALLHSVGDGNYDIAMDALRLTARNNNHDYQYHAAEVLFESDDANDQKIAMDALRFIAEDGDSPNQYCAAERLIQLRERNP